MKMKISKRLRNLSIIYLLVFLVSSCQNDDGATTNNEVTEASGTYELIELNVSPAQDINADGTASTNLLNELSCITGTIVLRSDGSYGLNLVGVEVTAITGGQFFIDCAPSINSSSNWNINAGQITLFADFTTTPYQLNGNTLTRAIGENLPGIQSVVYEKQ